jgi:single-strand DNA-binding protein
MEIIGRLTADAKVNELQDGRKVVNFSIAVNDNYKTKESAELKKATTYFNCSYWINSNICKLLTKGMLVQLNGRISVNTYVNTQGETKASLNFHVNNIKLHGKPADDKPGSAEPVDANSNEKDADDLPF